MLLGQARICDALGEQDEGVELYKQTLRWDAANVEAVACLASHHFYSDQPEMALRHYRRLLQMGVNSTELWNNVGLCCFFASQYDMTLHCFDRALRLATDDNMADVWFNVGHVAVGVGDLDMAHQAFEIALGVESTHAESFNNLGVLESRKGNVESARARTSPPPPRTPNWRTSRFTTTRWLRFGWAISRRRLSASRRRWRRSRNTPRVWSYGNSWSSSSRC